MALNSTSPVAGGGGQQPLVEDSTIQFIALDFTAAAFDLVDPDCTEDSPGTPMRFDQRLLDGANLLPFSNAFVIVVPEGDAYDPFADIFLYTTGSDGRPLPSSECLGLAFDDLREEPPRTLRFAAGSAYWLLCTTEQGVADAIMNRLRLYVDSFGLEADADVDDRAPYIADLQASLASERHLLPFFRVRAEDVGYDDLIHNSDLPGLKWLVDMRESWAAMSPPPSLLIRLLWHQAGLDYDEADDTGPRRLRSLLRLKVFQHGGNSYVESREDWPVEAGRAVLVRRPSIASLHVAELVDRELRRAALNLSAWRLGTMAPLRALADAAHKMAPIPDVHDALVEALRLWGVADAVGVAASQQTWLCERAYSASGVTDDEKIRAICSAVELMSAPGVGPAGDENTGTAIQIGSVFIDESPIALRYRKDESLREQIDAQARKDAERRNDGAVVVLSPKLLLFSALLSAHYSPASSFASSTSLIRATCRAYFEKYLFGFTFEGAVVGVNLRSLLEDSDTVIARESLELSATVRAHLRARCHVDRMTAESALYGASHFAKSTLPRMLAISSLHGWDWAVLKKVGQEGETPVWANRIEWAGSLMTPVKDIADRLRGHYASKANDVIASMVGEAKTSRPVLDGVQAHVESVTEYMGWLGDPGKGGKDFKFRLGLALVADTVAERSKVAVTIDRAESADLFQKVIAYETEKRGNGWAFLTADEEERAEFISQVKDKVVPAKFKGVPEYMGALVDVAGLTRDEAAAPRSANSYRFRGVARAEVGLLRR